MSLRLLRALKVLKERVNDGRFPDTGICSALPYLSYYDEDILCELFSKWPDFTGSYGYPVPAPAYSCMTYVTAYHNLHRWLGEYGLKRIELLNFCIEYLEESLK